MKLKWMWRRWWDGPMSPTPQQLALWPVVVETSERHWTARVVRWAVFEFLQSWRLFCMIIFALTGVTAMIVLAPPHILFEWQKGLPAALVAVCGVIITGLIAFRQYLVARAKLNLDLFERRFELFTCVLEFSLLLKNTNDLAEENLKSFEDRTLPAKFLFGIEVQSYILQLTNNAHHYLRYSTEPGKHGRALSSAEWKRIKALKQWFQRNDGESVKALFEQYLDFSKWR